MDAEAHDALLRVLARIANGAPLAAAASHEGCEGRDVLEVALGDPVVATALLVAQNERISRELWDLKRELESIASATAEAAGSADTTASSADACAGYLRELAPRSK